MTATKDGMGEEHEVLLQCVCHGYHFLELWYDEDWGFQFMFIERARGFREKVGAIWKVLKNDNLFDGEIIIRPEDYERVLKVLSAGAGATSAHSNNPKTDKERIV